MAINWDQHLLEPLQRVFGESVNYRPAGGEPYDITGVFDRAYTQEVDSLDDGVGITTTKPVLGVRDVVFRAPPKQGDRLYIPSVDTVFAVADVQPDSHGGTKLLLNKVR